MNKIITLNDRQMRNLYQFAGSKAHWEEILQWASDNLSPEDIFDETDLRLWAGDNGYEKKGKLLDKANKPPGSKQGMLETASEYDPTFPFAANK